MRIWLFDNTPVLINSTCNGLVRRRNTNERRPSSQYFSNGVTLMEIPSGLFFDVCNQVTSACPNLPTLAWVYKPFPSNNLFFVRQHGHNFPHVAHDRPSTSVVVYAVVRVSGRAQKNRTSENPISSLRFPRVRMGRWFCTITFPMLCNISILLYSIFFLLVSSIRLPTFKHSSMSNVFRRQSKLISVEQTRCRYEAL